MESLEFIFAIAILIMSVVAHEVMHGYVAYLLGDPTAKLSGRLTLNPIRHLDVMGSFIVPIMTYALGGVIFGWAKPVPYNPYNLRKGKWGPAIVAAAGPATNYSIAIIIGLLLRFSPALGIASPAFVQITSLIVLVNIVLGTFNLVPIPPLDGSKVLFALLPYRLDYIRHFIERYWLVGIGIFILFLWQFLFPIITLLFSLITGIGFGS
jgi:Zn-dependent protease